MTGYMLLPIGNCLAETKLMYFNKRMGGIYIIIIFTKIPHHNLIAQLCFLEAICKQLFTNNFTKELIKINHLRQPICLKERTSSDQNIKEIRIWS